ncbi:MAG TPA: hypothetical protein VFN92_04225 [Solirubrobacterales bacterium]|nr:hypothetical protein [Solirubrobacterales bacterium]
MQRRARTPAMAAVVADRIRSLEENAALIKARLPFADPASIAVTTPLL